MSEGFHPKPRISFPSALAVGIAGLDEVLEVEVEEACDSAEFKMRLARNAPEGFVIVSVTSVPPGAKKAKVRQMHYAFSVPCGRRDFVVHRLADFDRSDSWPMPRAGREGAVDLHRSLVKATLQDGLLRMVFRPISAAAAGPREVLSALGLLDLEEEGSFVTRTAVELDS